MDLATKQYSSNAPECNKGFPCGLSCIAKEKRCLENLPEETSEAINKYVNLLINNSGSNKDGYTKFNNLVLAKGKELEDFIEVKLNSEVSEESLSKLSDEDYNQYLTLNLEYTSSLMAGASIYDFDPKRSANDSEMTLSHVEKAIELDKKDPISGFFPSDTPNSVDVGESTAWLSRRKKLLQEETLANFGVVIDSERAMNEPIEISDTFAKNFANSLSAKQSFSATAGTPDSPWLGENVEDGVVLVKTKENSGVRRDELMKTYLEQGARDIHTGALLAIRAAIPEHIVPQGKAKAFKTIQKEDGFTYYLENGEEKLLTKSTDPADINKAITKIGDSKKNVGLSGQPINKSKSAKNGAEYSETLNNLFRSSLKDTLAFAGDDALVSMLNNKNISTEEVLKKAREKYGEQGLEETSRKQQESLIESRIAKSNKAAKNKSAELSVSLISESLSKIDIAEVENSPTSKKTLDAMKPIFNQLKLDAGSVYLKPALMERIAASDGDLSAVTGARASAKKHLARTKNAGEILKALKNILDSDTSEEDKLERIKQVAETIRNANSALGYSVHTNSRGGAPESPEAALFKFHQAESKAKYENKSNETKDFENLRAGYEAYIGQKLTESLRDSSKKPPNRDWINAKFDELGNIKSEAAGQWTEVQKLLKLNYSSLSDAQKALLDQFFSFIS